MCHVPEDIKLCNLGIEISNIITNKLYPQSDRFMLKLRSPKNIIGYIKLFELVTSDIE